tara:strand:+ start:1255 stop:1668 length:414 start_codon:yes stop_codon:yes gene_type:complete
MQVEIGTVQLWKWFQDSVRTLRRLPGERKQKMSSWVDFPDEYWTTYGYHDVKLRLPPPDSRSISRVDFILEIMQHVPDVEMRKMIWMRASNYPWKVLAREFGMHRTTLHKKLHHEMMRLVFVIHDEKKILQKLRNLL